MGSLIEITAATDGPTAALAAVPAWFATWEHHLSRFEPLSDLSRLNASSGTPQPVSDTLFTVLRAALAAAEATAGLVTPTVHAALVAAGYDRSFETGLSGPRRDADPSGSAAVPDWRGIVLDPGPQTVTLPAGLTLDLGGTAKGWCADQTAQALAAAAPVLVNAGGDIAVSGPLPDGSAWRIAITDPRDPTTVCAELFVEHGGVATSGIDYRRWQQGDTLAHHLIDPRTGRPSDSDVLTATVVAPTAAAADVAAKMVLLLGCDAGLTWLDRQPGLAGLVVRRDGTMVETDALDAYLWP